LSLKRDDPGILPNPGSIGGITEATKYQNPPEADGGVLGSAEPVKRWRRPMLSAKNWVCAADELPGVVEGDMSRRNMQ